MWIQMTIQYINPSTTTQKKLRTKENRLFFLSTIVTNTCVRDGTYFTSFLRPLCYWNWREWLVSNSVHMYFCIILHSQYQYRFRVLTVHLLTLASLAWREHSTRRVTVESEILFAFGINNFAWGVHTCTSSSHPPCLGQLQQLEEDVTISCWGWHISADLSHLMSSMWWDKRHQTSVCMGKPIPRQNEDQKRCCHHCANWTKQIILDKNTQLSQLCWRINTAVCSENVATLQCGIACGVVTSKTMLSRIVKNMMTLSQLCCIEEKLAESFLANDASQRFSQLIKQKKPQWGRFWRSHRHQIQKFSQLMLEMFLQCAKTTDLLSCLKMKIASCRTNWKWNFIQCIWFAFLFCAGVNDWCCCVQNGHDCVEWLLHHARRRTEQFFSSVRVVLQLKLSACCKDLRSITSLSSVHDFITCPLAQTCEKPRDWGIGWNPSQSHHQVRSELSQQSWLVGW